MASDKEAGEMSDRGENGSPRGSASRSSSSHSSSASQKGSEPRAASASPKQEKSKSPAARKERRSYRSSHSRSESRGRRHHRRDKRKKHTRKRSRSSSGSSGHRPDSRSRSCSRHSSRQRSSYRSYDHRTSYRRHRSRSRSPWSSRRRHVGDRERPQENRCLGVFGLSLYTDEQELRSIFGRYGPIEDLQIVYDYHTGKSRGFAFIYMKHVNDAVEAKEMAAGTEIDGRKIRVDYSITERAHTPTPGMYLGRPGGESSGYRSAHKSPPRRRSYHRSKSYSRSPSYRSSSRRH